MRKIGFITKKMLRKLLRIKGSPREIALGFAVGILVGFTPTFGFQMALILGINAMLKINKFAGVIAVQISNFFTAIPLYLFTTWVGSLILGGDFEMGAIKDELNRAMALKYFWWNSYKDFGVHWETFAEWWDIMLVIGAPLWVGGLIVGTICGVASYKPCLSAINKFRSFKESRREKRLERITKRLNAEIKSKGVEG